jgi:hypothetical protein
VAGVRVVETAGVKQDPVLAVAVEGGRFDVLNEGEYWGCSGGEAGDLRLGEKDVAGKQRALDAGGRGTF